MDPIYWNQAKTLFGRAKIARQRTQNIDTGIAGQLCRREQWKIVCDGGVLTKCSLWDNAFCPEVDQNGKEHRLGAEDRGPSWCTRVSRRPTTSSLTVLTQPFGKASAEGNSRVNPASSIIDKVPRRREQDGHLDECLHVGPYSRADDQVCDDHVPWTTVR